MTHLVTVIATVFGLIVDGPTASLCILNLLLHIFQSISPIPGLLVSLLREEGSVSTHSLAKKRNRLPIRAQTILDPLVIRRDGHATHPLLALELLDKFGILDTLALVVGSSELIRVVDG
jgi:hypothetical protein